MEKLSAYRLQSVLEHLPAPDAFGAAKVCRAWLAGQERLDARQFLQQIRPRTWADRTSDALSQDFYRKLLKDWHIFLKDCALQVAYIRHDQHLIFIDPQAPLVPAPQGADPFPVNKDSKDYRCAIKAFSLEHLWWHCLDAELFRWKHVAEKDGNNDEEEAEAEEPELEAVPGYKGDMSLPNLEEDLLAVLSLNAAWFHYSFWTRQLQAILLLRDGRFLLVGSCELQGTINSQASARVLRCFVSDSLQSLVALGQDPRSREILHTKLGFEGKEMPQLLKKVRLPRLPAYDQGGAEAFPKTFGDFRRADEETSEILFSNLQLSQEEARQQMKVGDLGRVKRTAETFIWVSCVCDDWGVPLGPVTPDLEQEYVARAHREDKRWISYSGGCHLGLRGGRFYSAEVVEVNGARCNVRYTDPSEWSSGASGFTSSEGADRGDTPIEAEVDVDRMNLCSTSRWFKSFEEVWERCGGFSCISLDFGKPGSSDASNASSVRCFGHLSESDLPQNQSSSFLKLADALADTLEAHLFRCKTLLEEKDLLNASPQAPQAPTGAWPTANDMATGKRLFLELLRTPGFWSKWTAAGGESPAKMATLFKKQKFVRLTVQ